MKKLITLTLLLLMLSLSVSALAVTYQLGNAVDDTWGEATSNVNLHTSTYLSFGAYSSGTDYFSDAYYRFALNIERGSTIDSAVLRFYCQGTRSGTFHTTIFGVQKDNKWETSDGFNATSYANCTALDATTKYGTSVEWLSVPAWTVNNWYSSPEIKTVLQAQIDDVSYDPDHAEDKYVAFAIRRGSVLNPSDDTTRRTSYSYDGNGVNSVELVVTYTPPAAASQVIFVTEF